MKAIPSGVGTGAGGSGGRLSFAALTGSDWPCPDSGNGSLSAGTSSRTFFSLLPREEERALFGFGVSSPASGAGFALDVRRRLGFAASTAVPGDVDDASGLASVGAALVPSAPATSLSFCCSLMSLLL